MVEVAAAVIIHIKSYMTRIDLDQALLRRICCGDPEAMVFLTEWSRYVHEIDDLVDGDRKGSEALLVTFARAPMLYSDPFYLKHLLELRRVVLVITNLYADSVFWEKSETAWQRDWADHNRHAGMEMVIAVAQITGGYEHARAISREQRQICWVEHHTTSGKIE